MRTYFELGEVRTLGYVEPNWQCDLTRAVSSLLRSPSMRYITRDAALYMTKRIGTPSKRRRES